MESAGGEEADRRGRWLAVKDDVHQHQLDSCHPSHGTCTHACPSDGIITVFPFCAREGRRETDIIDVRAISPIFSFKKKKTFLSHGWTNTDWI